jgi:hypothetical protein
MMFFIAAEMQALMIVSLADASLYFVEVSRGIAPESLTLPEQSGFSEAVRVVGFLLGQIGIFAALFFMWDIRHPRTK